MGISCVVTVTGISDLVSGRIAVLGIKAESVSAISAVGMGTSLNFPGKRMWGLARLLTQAGEVEVTAEASAGTELGVSGVC